MFTIRCPAAGSTDSIHCTLLAGATAGSSGSAASSSSSLSAAVDPKRVEKAEKFKAKGNQLYSAGRQGQGSVQESAGAGGKRKGWL